MFKHRCNACGMKYESHWERDRCMNCRAATEAEPLYIEAPFTAEWGTQAWIDDATERCRRASEEFARAAVELSCETDLQKALFRKQELIEKADTLIRSKWMRREIARAMERLVTPIKMEVSR